MNSSARAGVSGPQDRRNLASALIERLHADSEKVEEPRARALLESLAGGLARLSEAFDVYRLHCETAWRLGSLPVRLRDYAPRA